MITSEPITEPATATPVEIDTRLAALDHAFYVAKGKRAARLNAVHSYLGERARYVTRSRKEWPTSDQDAVTELEARLRASTVKPWDVDPATRTLAAVSGLDLAIKANRAEFAHLETEYKRRPWRRYIGVMGGHIHSGYLCVGGTIRPTTQITWQPTLSGKEVATAVAELGPLLCTHCFPGAPVEWQAGHAKPERCAGAGRAPREGSVGRQGMSTYGRCQECNTGQIVTTAGVIRAHKPAKKDA
jgi:hypothetical protein